LTSGWKTEGPDGILTKSDSSKEGQKDSSAPFLKTGRKMGVEGYMNWTEAFQRLGIEATKDERAVKNAYREKLAVTNPEDHPEGFKLLRAAYEEACRYAKEAGDAPEEEKPRDTTPSGLWMERVEKIYGNILSRQDVALWKELFDDDTFLSLEDEENCRIKFFRFLMEHFKLPTQVWKLLDKKLAITEGAGKLREKLPAHFVRYICGKCERGEDVEFDQFEGPAEADYDLFLQYYDRCWQALQEKDTEEAAQCLQSADALGIRHPVLEICRANLYFQQGRAEEAAALLEEERKKYPGDGMIGYNLAEILWEAGGSAAGEETDFSKEDGAGRAGKEGIPDSRAESYRRRAAEIFLELKAGNESHYMANIRLTEWYYTQKQYREAKRCAEKVLAAGGDDAFMALLGRVNAQIERELEAKYRETKDWEPALELCWCYLQDGKIARGIKLAVEIEKSLPPEKETEFDGLLAKLYVEQAEYEDSITMSQYWEASLEKRLADPERAEKRDVDRLRQAHLIRMQCYHNLGYLERENFELAIREAESVLEGGMKDVGILLEMAQIYAEMDEFERSLELSDRLVEEYQVFAAYAPALEVHKKQLNARGVVQAAGQCIRYFPTFSKAYEYLAKVYLDLEYREELEKVLADAEKNGVKSVILDAYRFQMDHKVMDTAVLNQKLKSFREDFLKHVEEGEQGFYENGLPILTEYLYHYPDDFMLVERGIYHRAAHHYQEAREDFEKALYVNPYNPYAFNGLSLVHKYLGDYERALFSIKKAILYMEPEMSAVIYADMGNLYALLGDYERALAAYRQYECLTGKCKSTWFGDNLAEYTMRMGRVEEAAAIIKRFFDKDKRVSYEKLAMLYSRAGREEQARQILRQWGSEFHAGSLKDTVEAVRRALVPGAEPKQDISSYPVYYRCRGWVELLFGSREAAVKAFGKMAGGLAENTMERMLCDAVFACILCGDDRRGRKHAKRLQAWLTKEKFSGRSRYYNREKGHLHMEFMAAYYTEPAEKLKVLLDREKKCEICHSCINPICKEMEADRILFLLRTGKAEEAEERLARVLEIQPWDEYMLAVRHVAFGCVTKPELPAVVFTK